LGQASRSEAGSINHIFTALVGGSEEMTEAEVKSIVESTVTQVFISFGLEGEDRKELQADLIHLRKWRKSVEQAQSYTFKIVITTIVTGFLGALWLGFQSILHK
jgi:hypothetical protein